jgi:hypothetical protein
MHQETEPRPGRRFCYGWVIVAVAAVSMAFWFGFRSIFSVFLVALVDDFGWSHAEISGVQSAHAKGQALKEKWRPA